MPLTSEGLMPHPGIASRYVQLADGSIAHYMTAGETGPAVLLLHGGIPGSSGLAGARFQLTFLGEHGFRAYAPDFPGYGLADTRPRYWPMLGRLSHLRFLKMFMDALAIDKAHMTGNSMGSTNTALFVVSHPERVHSYILVAGNIPGYVDPARVKRTLSVNAVNREWFDGTTASMRRMVEPIIYRHETITDDLLEMRTKAAIAQRESLKAYHAGNDRLPSDPNLEQAVRIRGRLEQITHPHILLWGANDVLNPVTNAYLQEDETPFMQYFYPEECGHQGQTDRPDLLNQVFLEFFKNGRLSRTTADAAGVSKRRPELPGIIG
ncbi:MAG: alpha/beta fold hydrolase [SAR202 cluster bacterium]|nr:alpha/beta fold hydrolase [SAR202 cluster bacterium]